jgi:hypothetical protein
MVLLHDLGHDPAEVLRAIRLRGEPGNHRGTDPTRSDEELASGKRDKTNRKRRTEVLAD